MSVSRFLKHPLRPPLTDTAHRFAPWPSSQRPLRSHSYPTLPYPTLDALPYPTHNICRQGPVQSHSTSRKPPDPSREPFVATRGHGAAALEAREASGDVEILSVTFVFGGWEGFVWLV